MTEISKRIKDPTDIRYAVILFAAFSVMITAVGAVGFFAISPLEVDISRLKDAAPTIVSRIENVEKDAAEARERNKNAVTQQLDAFRLDMNARIAEINRILQSHRKRHRK